MSFGWLLTHTICGQRRSTVKIRSPHRRHRHTHTRTKGEGGKKRTEKKNNGQKKRGLVSPRSTESMKCRPTLEGCPTIRMCVCVCVCVAPPFFLVSPPPPSILLTPLLLRQACLANKPTRCLGLLGIDKHRPLSPHFPSRGRCPIRWLALVMLRLYLLGRDRRDGTIATDHG